MRTKTPDLKSLAIRTAIRGMSLAADGRFTVRLARDRREVVTALRLRHDVFRVELGGGSSASDVTGSIEFDQYDLDCEHLIVIDRTTARTVGTYRLRTIDVSKPEGGFYSATEFDLRQLPSDVLFDGIEIGRACIAKEYRSSRVLFLLWKALLSYMDYAGKRYFFGCCSIFGRNPEIGSRAYHQLRRRGLLDERFVVSPKCPAQLRPEDESAAVELPSLFEMYLKVGAQVCGPPSIDYEFGTVDFFVVFDRTRMDIRYRRMFSTPQTKTRSSNVHSRSVPKVTTVEHLVP